jgi:hypothetical protein
MRSLKFDVLLKLHLFPGRSFTIDYFQQENITQFYDETLLRILNLYLSWEYLRGTINVQSIVKYKEGNVASVVS